MSHSVTELRCTVRFDESLRLDAELVDEHGSLVVVQDAVLWRPGLRGVGDPGAVLTGWASGRTNGRGSPTRLPDDKVSRQWGAFLGQALSQAIGGDVLDDLLIRSSEPSALLRISIRALDPLAGAIPYETLSWRPPDGATSFVALHEDWRVSIVRVPDSVHPLAPRPVTLAGHEPRELALAILGSEATDLDLDDYRVLASYFDAEGGDMARMVRHPQLEFTGGQAELASALREASPDLLVLVGHGSPKDGWRTDTTSIPPRRLAAILAGGPSTVLLAMCQSGTPRLELGLPPEDRWPVAAQLARAGVAQTIAFQGDDSYRDDLVSFAGALFDDLREPLGGAVRGEGELTLRDWELAVRAGRRQLGGSASPSCGVMPTLTVHPDLLLGRNARPAVRRHRGPRVSGRATATPWYVPGQIACGSRHGRPFRVPLPVDVGATVELTLRPEVPDDAGASSMTEADLQALRAEWPLPDRVRIQIAMRGQAPPPGWATRSAELGAAIRAIATVLHTSVPPSVCALLDRAVHDDFGAHDGAPRAVHLDSGARLRRFERWPALTVTGAADLPPPRRDEADVLLAPARDRELPDEEWAKLEAALAGEFQALSEIAADLRRRLGSPGHDRIRSTRAHGGAILVPDVAVLGEPATGEGGARLEGVGRRATDAPDVLT